MWDPTDLSRELASFRRAVESLSPANYWRDLDFNGTSDFTTLSSAAASTTTFSIVARGTVPGTALDANGAVFTASTGNNLGLYLDQINRVFYLATTGGASAGNSGAVAVGTPFVLVIIVTAGVVSYRVNGVAVAGSASMATFTPTRLGGISAAVARLAMDDFELAYFPGVALTVAQAEVLEAATLECLPATLAVINIGLSNIGVTNPIDDLEAGEGVEAAQARLHWSTCLEEVLRAFAWPFCTRYETLAVVGGTADVPVNDDWQYSYREPDDSIFARRVIATGSNKRRLFDSHPPPFRRGSDSLGGLIYTNETAPVLEFTVRVACPASMGDALFRTALGWRLSAAFAPGLSRNKLTTGDCMGVYTSILAKATVAAANEQQPQDGDGDASWIEARQ